MNPMSAALTLVGVLALVPVVAVARQPQHPAAAYRREVPRRLVAQAKVGEDSALKIASARIPGGKVQALELENENGKLIWSWEFTLAGRPGIYECNVSALDGSIVGVEHEMPKSDSTRSAPGPTPTPRP